MGWIEGMASKRAALLAAKRSISSSDRDWTTVCLKKNLNSIAYNNLPKTQFIKHEKNRSHNKKI
jgi:hypothetical protein